jgi:DNA replication factor GINS
LDEFFQKLRKIQKKERNEGGLARVGEDFYKRVHRYLEELMDTVGNDPFAKEQYLLRDTQRIATEICERREHKITDSAVMNIQRSYHLFKGKPQFDLQDTTPLNLTPEEEKLYFSLIDTLKGYRGRIIPSLDVLDDPQIVPNNLIATEQGAAATGVSSQISASKTEPASKSLKPLKPLENILTNQDNENGVVEDFNEEGSFGFENGSPSKQIVDPLEDRESEDDFTPPIRPEELSKSKSKTKKPNMDLKTMVIFDELPSIVGVDEKVYGPFYPQDVVKMPEINAQIFIKARKGRYIKS